MTRHQICQEAERTRCRGCGVPPGCACPGDRPGVCLCRCVRARMSGLIDGPALASVIDDGLAAAGGVGRVLDPVVTA